MEWIDIKDTSGLPEIRRDSVWLDCDILVETKCGARLYAHSATHKNGRITGFLYHQVFDYSLTCFVKIEEVLKYMPIEP